MTAVSIIIPVYNVASYLRCCLDSVVNQSIKDIEIICVDDGSTDNSPNILREYAESDNRIQIITQANAGPGAARNTGLSRARGEYLIFLDSDDWFEQDFLEQMVDKALQTSADVVICKTVEFDSDTSKEYRADWMLKEQYLPGDTFAPEDIATHLFQFTYGMPWDKLYRRQWLIQLGIEFPRLSNSEDLAFVFPSILAANRITIVDKILVHHRVNRNTSVSNSREKQPDAPYIAFQIVQQYLYQMGKSEFYQRSFINWAIEFFVWHISNMENFKIQKEYFFVFRRKWIPELKLDQYSFSYFINKVAYAKYLLVRYCPFSIFRVGVRLYHSLKQKRKA